MTASSLWRQFGFLDTTYKSGKYSLPLFFLVIQNNVNYQVAAVFVTQEGTFKMISQGLQK